MLGQPVCVLIRRKGFHRVSDKIDSSYLQISLATNILPSTFALRAQMYFHYHRIIGNSPYSTNNDAFNDAITMGKQTESKNKTNRKNRGISLRCGGTGCLFSGISKFSASLGRIVSPTRSSKKRKKRKRDKDIYPFQETSHCANRKNKCYLRDIIRRFVSSLFIHTHAYTHARTHCDHTYIQFSRLGGLIRDLWWYMMIYDDLLNILQNELRVILSCSNPANIAEYSITIKRLSSQVTRDNLSYR